MGCNGSTSANTLAVQTLLETHLRDWLGEMEKIGLPTTQKQEQCNYEKKIRNALRTQVLERAGVEREE